MPPARVEGYGQQTTLRDPLRSWQPTGISYSCQTLGAPICPDGMMPALHTSSSFTTTLSLPDPPVMPRHESHLQTIIPQQTTILQCHSTASEQAGWHRQGAPQRIKEGTHQGLQRFGQGTEAQCYQLYPRNTKKTQNPQEMSRTAHCSATATTTGPGCSCLYSHPSGYGDLLKYTEHIVLVLLHPNASLARKEIRHPNTTIQYSPTQPPPQKYLPRSAALASFCTGQRGCFLCSNDLHYCITARTLLHANTNDHFPFS